MLFLLLKSGHAAGFYKSIDAVSVTTHPLCEFVHLILSALPAAAC